MVFILHGRNIYMGVNELGSLLDIFSALIDLCGHVARAVCCHAHRVMFVVMRQFVVTWPGSVWSRDPKWCLRAHGLGSICGRVTPIVCGQVAFVVTSH